MTDNLETENKIKELEDSHRRLDQQAQELSSEPNFDQIKLQQLKKRKLAIKDQIAYLTANDVPDIIA